MTDRRRHRGPHPNDQELFGEKHLAALRSAVADYSLLLTRGYAPRSSLKLVGDRYDLTARQRMAVARSACGDGELERRREREIPPEDVVGVELGIDGFNVLTTIESALSGAMVLMARDGCYRDLAGMHGGYRLVEETRPAIELALATIDALAPARVRWLLDQPVSNSGRLAELIREVARGFATPTEVEVVPDPDPVLAKLENGATAATADSAILDRCGSWLNLARLVIDGRVSGAWIVSLDGAPE